MRAINLKQFLGEGKTALNAWLTIPSSWTAEVIAHAGFEAITIDMQHGLADYQVAVSMLQAISTKSAFPLVRLPWNDPVFIMRLLDAGALGLICPMINSRTEAKAFVDACHYPPAGYRSYGPSRASLYAGDDYFRRANELILTMAMIETVEALERIEEIITTPGLDGIYIGTIDLSISMGLESMGDLSDPLLKRALEKIHSLSVQHNRTVGIHARSPHEAIQLSQMGYHFVTVVTDTKILRNASTLALSQVRNGL